MQPKPDRATALRRVNRTVPSIGNSSEAKRLLTRPSGTEAEDDPAWSDEHRSKWRPKGTGPVPGQPCRIDRMCGSLCQRHWATLDQEHGILFVLGRDRTAAHNARGLGAALHSQRRSSALRSIASRLASVPRRRVYRHGSVGMRHGTAKAT